MMKPNIFLLDLVLASALCSPVVAESVGTPPPKAVAKETSQSAESESAWRSMCEPVSSLAETIMRNRQHGAPMVGMMKKLETVDPNIRNVIKSLIITAYEKPRWNSDQMVLREVQDFRDQSYLACIKSFQK